MDNYLSSTAEKPEAIGVRTWGTPKDPMNKHTTTVSDERTGTGTTAERAPKQAPITPQVSQ